MKGSVLIAVGCAAILGIALGALGMYASDRGQTSADLNVASTWSGKALGYDVRVYSGSAQGDPGHGVVFVETSGQKPVLFSAAAGTGAFRLVSHWDGGWAFRAADGSLAVVNGASPATGGGPSYTFLGKPLDATHLGPIGTHGVAVPVSYGAYLSKKHRPAQTAVVLVQQVEGRWKLYGYLPGYWIPRRTLLGDHIRRPLVAPDGTAYLIDSKQRRLVPAAIRGSVAPGYAIGAKFGKCTTWPAPRGGSYIACPNAITLQQAGTSRTLFRRDLGKQTPEWAWNFVQPSPNGKWLLVEDTAGFCGNPTWADFLPAGGGSLQPAFPGLSVSEALGWLPDNSALIAAQSQGCPGVSSGIYEVWPSDSPSSDPNLGGGSMEVFAGDVSDATTWGFGH